MEESAVKKSQGIGHIVPENETFGHLIEEHERESSLSSKFLTSKTTGLEKYSHNGSEDSSSPSSLKIEMMKERFSKPQLGEDKRKWGLYNIGYI
ncbi:hypothetical protein SDJN03_28532, partial [Cucurbita argyrosperma subsp. sororia]